MPRARFVILSIAFGALAGVAMRASDRSFRAGSALSYPHQSGEQVTVGAKAYDTDELTEEAFGKKADLLKYGVLPVLVVIENKRGTALDLRRMEVTLVAADGRHATAVDPEELPALGRHANPPSATPHPPLPLPKKKNPLAAPEIEARAFAAKIVPPGDSVSGFLYFEARPEKGDKLYVNGLEDARTGHEILYFEFELDK